MERKLELFRFVAYLPEFVEYRVMAETPKEAYKVGMREVETRLSGVAVRKVEITRYNKENGGRFEGLF